MSSEPAEPSPFDQLSRLAVVEAEIAPGQTHVEVYTMEGLLSLHMHGPPDAENVVVMCGGAMGGVLGPARGLYVTLGAHLAERGIASVRVGYRKPNDLVRCTHDLAAAIDLRARAGAQRFISMGHSFGGAPAVQVGRLYRERCAGVVTLATQSAGCEAAEELDGVPLLLFHGDRDEILPPMASEMVRMLAGHGELVPLPGAGHLLDEAADTIRDRLVEWIPTQFGV